MQTAVINIVGKQNIQLQKEPRRLRTPALEYREEKLGNMFLQTKTLQLTDVQPMDLLTLHVRTHEKPVEEKT